MGKHSKPSLASNLRTASARTGAVLALSTAGMLAAGSMASASTGADHWEQDKKDHKVSHSEKQWQSEDDFHNSSGLINVSDNNVQVTGQVCNNDVPVNAVGGQAPIDEIAGAIGILNQGDVESSPQQIDNCAQDTDQEN